MKRTIEEAWASKRIGYDNYGKTAKSGDKWDFTHNYAPGDFQNFELEEGDYTEIESVDLNPLMRLAEDTCPSFSLAEDMEAYTCYFSFNGHQVVFDDDNWYAESEEIARQAFEPFEKFPEELTTVLKQYWEECAEEELLEDDEEYNEAADRYWE